MVKLIISDFDGVLLDLKEIHFEALNKALMLVDPKFVITPEQHIKTFDGLSTSRKLRILADTRGFPQEKFIEVNEHKQLFTSELLKDFVLVNTKIIETITELKARGYLFYVASNAIRHTIELGLEKLQISHLVDHVFSNQDVKNSKPNPEIYLRCMIEAGVSPSETLIIEDSKHGRESAVQSGAHVCGVDNSFDFTLERIESALVKATVPKIRWSGKSDVNVLIPMAGAGSRFAKAGYKLPKPMIDVRGKAMIHRVVENLNMHANFIFVVQKEHYELYNLKAYLEILVPDCQILVTDGLTAGAACTTLLAKKFIDNDNHLIIANSDQFVEWDSCDFMYSLLCNDADGGILTFKDTNPKWSYARTDELGKVVEVAEKNPISDNATVGIYYWKRGSDYVRLAEQMIQKNIRVNNEFYVCPVFNEAILENKLILTHNTEKMWGLGTPEDLTFFLDNYKGSI